MKNWKTNLGGLLSLVVIVLQVFDVISPEQGNLLLGGIVVYIGGVAKDYNSTGK